MGDIGRADFEFEQTLRKLDEIDVMTKLQKYMKISILLRYGKLNVFIAGNTYYS